MDNRDLKFGRLLAIANVLGQKVFEKEKPSISEEHWKRYDKKPYDVFVKMHKDLMNYTHKFGEEENILIDLFGEILAEMDESEFTNEPLERTYLLGFYQQGNALNNITGVNETSEITGLSPGTIKNYCADGKIEAKKIGNTWVIDKIKLEESLKMDKTVKVSKNHEGYNAEIQIQKGAFSKVKELFNNSEDKALKEIEHDVINILGDFYDNYKDNNSNDKIETGLTIAAEEENNFLSYDSVTLFLQAKINDYGEIEGDLLIKE